MANCLNCGGEITPKPYDGGAKKVYCTKSCGYTYRSKRNLKTERGREADAEKRARDNASGKRQARGKLRRAVDKGLIIKPAACSLCGGTKNIEAHHEDYERPLDVEWLCLRCHRELHLRKKKTRE